MSEKPMTHPEWHESAGHMLPALLKWAECQTPGWLRARLDPADLVQQTLLETRPPAGLTEHQLLAYLRRALSNNLIDAARKHARLQGDVPLDVLAASSLEARRLAGRRRHLAQRACRPRRAIRPSGGSPGPADRRPAGGGRDALHRAVQGQGDRRAPGTVRGGGSPATEPGPGRPARGSPRVGRVDHARRTDHSPLHCPRAPGRGRRPPCWRRSQAAIGGPSSNGWPAIQARRPGWPDSSPRTSSSRPPSLPRPSGLTFPVWN